MKKNSSKPARLPSGKAKTQQPKDWRKIYDRGICSAFLHIADDRHFPIERGGMFPEVLCTFGQFQALERAAREMAQTREVVIPAAPLCAPSRPAALAVVLNVSKKVPQSEPNFDLTAVDHLDAPPTDEEDEDGEWYPSVEQASEVAAADTIAHVISMERWLEDLRFAQICVECDLEERAELVTSIERMENEESDARQCGMPCDWTEEIEIAKARIQQLDGRLAGFEVRGLFS